MSLTVDMEAVFLIAFNFINRKVMLHSLKFICPIIATYIIDPTALGAYALGILSLIKFILESVNLNEMNAKEVAFADHFSVVCSLNSIKDYWTN